MIYIPMTLSCDGPSCDHQAIYNKDVQTGHVGLSSGAADPVLIAQFQQLLNTPTGDVTPVMLIAAIRALFAAYGQIKNE